MKRTIATAAHMLLLFGVAQAQAQDVEIVANSTIKAYAEYCVPTFFGQQRGADAQWDSELALSFERALFTQYGGRCDKFYAAEVLPSLTLPYLLQRLAGLLKDSATPLTAQQLQLLGALTYLDELDARKCPGTAPTAATVAKLRSIATGWWDLLGRDGMIELARGYTMEAAYLGPSDHEAACYSRDRAYELAAGLTMTYGYVPFPSFQDVAPWPDINPVADAPAASTSDEPAASPWPEGSSTFPEEREYVWEPGDPGTNRGGDEQPIDLSRYVAKADSDAVATFAGTWGSTAACDEGHLYLIGQFSWNDGRPIFGKGVPRISTEHLSCEAGQWSVTGDIATFTALCHPGDGPAWSGTGTIRRVSATAVQLFLMDEPQPTQLERCTVQMRRDTFTGTIGQQQVPQDLFGN